MAEIHAALEANIPIVTVNLIGHGYDYAQGAKFLSNFTSETLDQANVGASAILEDLGINVNEFGKQLSTTVPKIIAVDYNSNAGKRVLEAQLDTLIDRIIGS